ncbi:TetR/AcrR family transcriptional regulator [Streptomyces roseoverticillatus]|uniref:TetR/AcrR family transcriptional regulator n=1 Tax=Streptomyces roseoverticillatus TaxID=66429 RepID=UPI001F27947C|nr:TetR/AcrR family transcriptional regulator [Streptomyces roseoverticillatus]MCF3102222.1 TetR/AcrR family transcriptional regulator [Streptomyces roseoverticillatus]
MRGHTTSNPQVRGTSRGPRAAERIYEATLELLAERGYQGLTVESVAERAGVNKTTIYRWWSSKAPLLRSALLHSQVLDVEISDTGSLRGDLVALAGQMMRLVSDERTSAVARAMLSGGGEGELALVARDFFADRLEREKPLFARAVARGELAVDADPVLLVDLIAGAVWMRVLLRQLPVEEGFVESIVDAVVPRLQVSDPPKPSS